MHREDVVSVQEQPVSKIEETNKVKELRLSIGGNVPKAEREKKIIDRGEFNEARKKGLVDWDRNGEILEVHVGDFYEMGNRELEEQVNNAIAESQLENPQYKLPQRNEKYSRERSTKAIEREAPGMRKEIHKGELIAVMGAQKGE